MCVLECVCVSVLYNAGGTPREVPVCAESER